MNINSVELTDHYQRTVADNDLKRIESNSEVNTGDDRLKELADEFTSILMKQMFKAMRKTVPESSLIDGGFSEDVFTDMLDDEYSKAGARQNTFNNLSRALYEQLQQGN
ncbi:hypothetical protein GM661_02845 [Iocasia frigidifontis]|uniref:Flagellar protein FlgJ N-terminal domain-containing protein n=1 Tax=Iocasia fonsfrigidae TaxID=2682810 RepID=A0A8A7KC86_9FIRM|nr:MULTISPECIES: rod-binding protein [Halanaerobiaceae]AZO94071.1 hypothetical protein D7D81_05390 [Halocella sp. SP3-1]QTL96989.1 hypothetical protein GM661_02845 [Iocasia fonsfrigidae]